MPSEIPADRRALAKNEHLFLPRPSAKKCRAHLWGRTQIGASGEVVACTVCGRLRQGETMPIRWEPIIP